MSNDEVQYVITRSGNKELLNPDQITQRLIRLMNRVPRIDHINPYNIMIAVIRGITDNISTHALDVYSAEIAASLSIKNPNYLQLAARIAVDNHQKNTLRSFVDKMRLAYLNKNGAKSAPLINQKFYKFIELHQDEIESMIDYNRDFNLDYFGFGTFQRLYSIKVNDKAIERPQDMFMRASIAIHIPDNIFQPEADTFTNIRQMYDALSNRLFSMPSPVYFNAGGNIQQFCSCFLLGTEDSLEGIKDTEYDAAIISKWSGGIGIHIHNWRSKGSRIRSTNGISNGIVPFLRMYNNNMRAFNQGGRRLGSAAIYLAVHHPDIMDFLQLRRPDGDEFDRARDLNYAVWIPDLFMERVKTNQPWSLFDPDDCGDLSNLYDEKHDKQYTNRYLELENMGLARKVVSPREIMSMIYQSNLMTGMPYVCFSDTANRLSNQKNIGVIRSSNLCVSPDTMILTDKGYFNIQTLTETQDEIGIKYNVWDGVEFSPAIFSKTGRNKSLSEISFSNGSVLHCTKEHLFFMKNKLKMAVDLKSGDVLSSFKLPVIDTNEACPDAYTYGIWYGHCSTNRSHELCFDSKEKEYYINLPKTDNKIIGQMTNITIRETDYGFNVHLKSTPKIPVNCCAKDKMSFLKGIFDTCSKVDVLNFQLHCIIISHYATEIMYLLNTLGYHSSFVDGKLCINRNNYVKIKKGIAESTSATIKIVNVKHDVFKEDTYCFATKREAGIFNGVMSHNCTEIYEYSDSKESAVCNLCSINLESCVVDLSENPNHEFPEIPSFDFNKLLQMAQLCTKTLNRVIDINNYPTEKTRISNIKHRPIAVGVQGQANAYMKMRYPFASPEARDLNKKIYETILFGCYSESTKLARAIYLEKVKTDPTVAKTVGAYSSFLSNGGSPMANGIFPWEMAGLTDADLSGMYDWNTLRDHITTFGMVNSLCVALMPTATSSQLLGNNECFEPFTTNMYKRKTLAGEYVIFNKYLIKDLFNMNLWNDYMQNYMKVSEGMLQHIEGLPQEMKDLYATAFEIPVEELIQQSIDRQPFIDQGQSLNLYKESPLEFEFTKYMFMAWRGGLKTGKYYFHSRAPVMPGKFTVDPAQQEQILKKIMDAKKHVPARVELQHDVCLVCSG